MLNDKFFDIENRIRNELNSENEAIKQDIIEAIGEDKDPAGTLIPFSYLGGKYKHLNWLLPLLPKRKAYVEPFGGSGVVLLNRQRSEIETFNDKYSEVVNFFRVLRNNPGKLLREIVLTPYSEEEFVAATKNVEDVGSVERARRFFIVVNNSFDKNLHSPNWSYSINFSSKGVSKNISSYRAKLRRLVPIADRLRDVQITNRDAIDVIETFDTEDGLIYCDPPYPPSVREFEEAYGEEMVEEDHRKLGEVLRKCEADVAVSSYKSDLYGEIFTDYGWKRIDADPKRINSSKKGDVKKIESLYVNYSVGKNRLMQAFE